MALFMVLFSISSVNTSKFESLQRAMQDAFSGKILSGGKSIQQTGADTNSTRPAATPPIPAIQAMTQQLDAARQSKAAARRTRTSSALKQQIDAYAKAHGLEDKLQTTVARRGLVVRLLTDKVLYDSGSATLNPAASPLLDRIATLLQSDFDPPHRRRGAHRRRSRSRAPRSRRTGSCRPPARPPSSDSSSATTSRAGRLAASGYGAQHPITTNATAAGRARNRRVEIVLTREK